jgi:hypothetical protein
MTLSALIPRSHIFCGYTTLRYLRDCPLRRAHIKGQLESSYRALPKAAKFLHAC